MRFIYSRVFGIFFACLVALAILVFAETKGWLFPVREVLLSAPRPVAAAVRGVARPVSNFFATIYQLRNITRENVQLTSRVSALEQDLVQLDQYKRENDALKAELGFAAAARQSYQSCTVLAYNPLNLTDTLQLNCGSEAGIQQGAAVVSQGYLVGKVMYVTRGSSTVLLITSSKFQADARVSKTNAAGIIGGSFSTGIILDRLSQNDDLQKGWVVVTAGINSNIPKNILVGQVGDVISHPNDLFKKATVLSPIDYENIKFVFVAKGQ